MKSRRPRFEAIENLICKNSSLVNDDIIYCLAIKKIYCIVKLHWKLVNKSKKIIPKSF